MTQYSEIWHGDCFYHNVERIIVDFKYNILLSFICVNNIYYTFWIKTSTLKKRFVDLKNYCDDCHLSRLLYTDIKKCLLFELEEEVISLFVE